MRMFQFFNHVFPPDHRPHRGAVPPHALMAVPDVETQVRVLAAATQLFAAGGFEKATV